MPSRFHLLLVVAFAIAAVAPRAQADTLFWTDAEGVVWSAETKERVPVQRFEPTQLVEYDFAGLIHATEEELWWISRQSGAVWKARWDGSEEQQIGTVQAFSSGSYDALRDELIIRSFGGLLTTPVESWEPRALLSLDQRHRGVVRLEEGYVGLLNTENRNVELDGELAWIDADGSIGESILTDIYYGGAIQVDESEGAIFFAQGEGRQPESFRLRKVSFEGVGEDLARVTGLASGLLLVPEERLVYWSDRQGVHRMSYGGRESERILDVTRAYGLLLVRDGDDPDDGRDRREGRVRRGEGRRR
jgi:hypothetical protein